MNTQKTADELMQLVLDSFEAEHTHDVERGREIIADDFSLRHMIVSGETLFPLLSGDDVKAALVQEYAVEGREFHVWNIAANEATQTVFVELAEVVPREGQKQVWAYALVCQIEEGKIKRTRHYGDPATMRRVESVAHVESVVK